MKDQNQTFTEQINDSLKNVRTYDDLPTATIKGLEIFSAGKWNGDEYSDSDLDSMVSAFNQVGFEPTVKAGHADGQESEREARKVFGAPALGYVDRIYRQGSKLLADFKDIPRKFADLIKAGAYKRVSSEVYWNYKRGERTFPRVLKAVAFLGADIPAITNLKAVENLYKQNDTGAIYAYDQDQNEFHVYEKDYGMDMGMGMGMSMPDYLVSVPRKAKSEVNFSETNDPASSGKLCANCEYYLGSYKSCSLVEGMIDPQDLCDLFEPYEQGEEPSVEAMSLKDIDPRALHIYKSYPWPKCIADNEPKYGKDKAQAICAAIKNRTVNHMLTTGLVKSAEEAIQKIAQKIDDDPVYAYAWKRFFEENGQNDPAESAYALPGSDYKIEKMKGQFCVVSKSDGKTHGCKDNMADAMKLMGSMSKNNANDSDAVWFTVAQMERICPSCADAMRAHKYSKIKIADKNGNLLPGFADKLGVYTGFSKGLCDKFGDGAGFRTRCMKTMNGEGGITDVGAFCNSLKEYCFGNVTAGDTKKQSEKNSGGTDMTEEEVNALMKKREEELKGQMFKEFEDRIHKAREEGKEEANKENELLREDIRKLQLEKRSERIEHWIKNMKDQGKIAPAEESKVRSLRQWMPDEGPELKYFAVKDGTTKEFTAGPAELFEDFIAKRQSLFTNYSRADSLEEDDGHELPDPSAEVDRRAKQYMERSAKENKKVSYKDALTYVLRTNAGLAQRYQDAARPN